MRTIFLLALISMTSSAYAGLVCKKITSVGAQNSGGYFKIEGNKEWHWAGQSVMTIATVAFVNNLEVCFDEVKGPESIILKKP
jgi:hypothetical protein